MIFAQKWRPTASIILGLALGLSLSACGDSHDHDDDHDDTLTPAQEACLHATDSPTDVDGAASAEEATATVNASHTLYRISLVETDGEYGGAVVFTAPESSDYEIFTSANVPLTVYDAAGTSEIGLESSYDVDECIEIARGQVVELEAGAHVLYFGPTSEPEVSIVIEKVDDHDGHGH